MAYKPGTVVVTTIPISLEHKNKLDKLKKANEHKSKTQLSKQLLEEIIDAKYNDLIRHDKKE